MHVKATSYCNMEITTSRSPVWAQSVSPYCVNLNGIQRVVNRKTDLVNIERRLRRSNKLDAIASNSVISKHAQSPMAEELDQGFKLAEAISSSQERNQIDDILQKMHGGPIKHPVAKTFRGTDILWSPDYSPRLLANVGSSYNVQKHVSSPYEQPPFEVLGHGKRRRHGFVPPLFLEMIGAFPDELVPEATFERVCFWRERSNRVISEQEHEPEVKDDKSSQEYQLAATVTSLMGEQKQIDEFLKEMQGNQKMILPITKRAIDICWNPESQRCLGMEIVCSINSEPSAKLGDICLPCTKPVLPSPQVRQRNVRFGHPTIHTYREDPEIGKLDLWWKRGDLKMIMSENLHTAGKAKQQTIVAQGLDRALQLAVTMASLVGDRSQLDELLEKMEEEHRGLQLWCQYGHARRGLERFTSRQYNSMRRKQMNELCRNVVSLSEQGADPDIIRQVSERFSSDFAILARMFGIADYKAARSTAHDEIDGEVPVDDHFHSIVQPAAQTRVPKRFSI